jgi:hypothetical protein
MRRNRCVRHLRDWVLISPASRHRVIEHLADSLNDAVREILSARLPATEHSFSIANCLL